MECLLFSLPTFFRRACLVQSLLFSVSQTTRTGRGHYILTHSKTCHHRSLVTIEFRSRRKSSRVLGTNPRILGPPSATSQHIATILSTHHAIYKSFKTNGELTAPCNHPYMCPTTYRRLERLGTCQVFTVNFCHVALVQEVDEISPNQHPYVWMNERLHETQLFPPRKRSSLD